MAELARVQNVRVGHRVGRQTLWALDGVTLSLDEGETVGVVGESGSGKSTLGRVLLGVLPPTEGTATFRGQELAGLSKERARALRKDLQLVFQDPYGSLHPRRTVGEAVREPLEVHRPELSVGEVDFRVRALLEQVGLGEAHARKLPSELSGGQRQRVAIARALVTEPALVVADEPVSALDVSVQAQVLNLLLDVRAARPLTLVLVSHDLKVVRRLAQRVVVLYLGRVVETGPVAEVYSAPKHPYTHALLSAIPRLGTQASARVVLEGEVPSPLAPPSGCPFHPRCPKFGTLGESERARCRAERPELVSGVACHFPR